MLESQGVKVGIMPIGGWRYIQTLPQGGEQRIPPSGCAGIDYRLVEYVKNFRVSAGIDLGDVEADVASFIKAASPINDKFPGRNKAKASTSSASSGFRPYIERIKDWLLVVSGRTPRLLLEDDADTRAEICKKCQHNVPWKTGCLPCCESIVSRGQNVRQRPSYKHDKKLGACRLHDTHISTAIFIDRDDLPALNPQAPEICWMRVAA